MILKMTKMDVWAADIDDRAGGLSTTLRTIADSGAELECVLARRDVTRPGKGVVFITSLEGKEQMESAAAMGLHRAGHIATLRIEGDDRPGMGAELTRVIATTGVSLHGFTALALGNRFVCYASFDSVADLEKAEQVLNKLNTDHWAKWKNILHRKEKTATSV